MNNKTIKKKNFFFLFNLSTLINISLSPGIFAVVPEICLTPRRPRNQEEILARIANSTTLSPDCYLSQYFPLVFRWLEFEFMWLYSTAK
jgi:hypothetical protein